HGLLLTIALLLFLGVMGKSAQFPLHIWLPDAMAGPTPVSALIHAATMVVAGVYLVARVYGVFWEGFSIEAGGLNWMALIAGITMIIAAALAFVQDDIKRVLAYSTVSQLGYMVAALSVGAWTAGVFHLFTHAFFKALLFLGSGSVIHAVHSNNMSEMGGLKKYMPTTFVTFIIGTLALAGIFPLAGFWSKDEILLGATEGGYPFILILGLIGAFMTACYMGRCVFLTFFGEYRGHGHPHEAPVSMTAPLVALAGATLTVGFLGAPQLGAPFADWVFFEEPHAPEFLAWVAALSIGAAALGIAVGWLAYGRERDRDPVLELGPVTTLLQNRYYMDHIYMRGIIFPIRDKVSAAVYWTNQHLLDGAVNGAAWLARAFGQGAVWFDRNVIDGAVHGVAGIAGFTGGLLRYIQSGNVQRYAAFLFTGVVILAIIFTRI
ncbi:MAG: NADH-quinone oxidoreductase subunit 5 family protein, partial [Candidatus Rokuibacteriota bacterium]